MAPPPPLLPLADAWREQLRADMAHELQAARLRIVRRGDGWQYNRHLQAPHCADVYVECTASTADAPLVRTRLGELLRLVRLAAALHVDAAVFNALWRDDASCAMGADRCARCDAVDRCRVKPTVTLAIVRPPNGGDDRHSGLGVISDALFAWREERASAAFLALRDALLRLQDDDDAPPVELVITMGYDKGDAVLRDLETLQARRRACADATWFRLARIVPAFEVSFALFAPLHTAIVDAGICIRPCPLLSAYALPEVAQHAWQWLLDWAARATAPPHVDSLTLVYFAGLAPETLRKLLDIAVTHNATLRELDLNWPLPAQSDADARRRAAEVIGAGLLGKHARLHQVDLHLDLGELTEHDVAALERGAATHDDSERGSATAPRFQSVHWKAHTTPEALVARVARLLGAVGTRELDIIFAPEPWRSYRVLKAVLEHGGEALTALKWSGIRCQEQDVAELEAPWASVPRQLRELHVYVDDEHEPNTLRALDALLAQVGSQLTSLFVGSQTPGGLTARAAEIIVARCPRLRALSLAAGLPMTSAASTPFYEHLLDAYEHGRCGVSTLTAHGSHEDAYWLPLLHALRDGARAVTRSLRTLVLGSNWWYKSQPGDVVLATLMETLATNATLTRVSLWSLGNMAEDTQRQLRALPHQFAVRLPSRRRQLALLSVSDGKHRRLAKLPREVLAAIFEFAGRRAPRYEYPT